MLRTEGNRCRHTVASSQFLEHWPGGVCRKTGSVMCAGEGTATGTAPCSCSGANRAPPGPTQVLLPWTIGNAPREPPDHTRCIGTTYAGGRRRTDGGRDASLSQSPDRRRIPAQGPSLLGWTKCGSLRGARPRSRNSTRSKSLERTTPGHDLSARGNVAKVDNSGWSLYGAQRSQPVATGSKRDGAENGSLKRKPLPSVATSCLSRSMVRRGSTVRVRQRASAEKKSPEIGVFVCLAVAMPRPRSTFCAWPRPVSSGDSLLSQES